MTVRFRPNRGRVTVPAVERPRAVSLAPYIVVALTTAGGILRVLALGSKGLWLDEAFSVWLGSQSLPELYAWLLRIDQHPPLYYTFLHLWIRVFGDTAFSVRLLSALFGTLTIPVMFLLGRRLLGTAGGLVAATILTIAPFHVRFAQETRMYTLLTLNVALALFFLARLLTDARAATDPLGAQLARWFDSWRAARLAETARTKHTTGESGAFGYAKNACRDADWASRSTAGQQLPLSSAATDLSWLGLIFFTVAAMLSHNTAVLFPLSTNLFVLGFILWRQQAGTPSNAVSTACPAQLAPPLLRNWFASQGTALLLWSPWFAAFVIQATGVYREFWLSKPTLMTIALAVGSFFSAHLPVRAALIGTVGAVFAVLLVLGAFHLRRSPALFALLATLFAAPFVGELLVSAKRPIFYDRTLIYITIPLYLLLAAGILQLRLRRPHMLAALAAIVAINGVSLYNYYANFEKEQWREAAAYVAGEVQEGDLLIFNATWVQIPFDFYFRDANRPVEERGAPVDLFDRGLLEPKMAQSDVPRLQELIRGRERVWLIYSHNWYTDPQGIIPEVLAEELRLLKRRPFFGLDVRLYVAPV